MPIDLYYTRMSGPSRAVWMTARELNIDVKLKPLDLSAQEQLKPEFIKINPAHTVPTIDDNGFSVWESRAIMQYLCNQYAPNSTLYPKDPKKRALVDRTLNFEMGLQSNVGSVLFAKMMTGVDPPEDKVNALKNSLKVLDQLIGSNRYVTGDQLTIADLSLLATTTYLDWGDYDLSEYANYKRWFNALKSELKYYQEVNGITKEELNETMAKYKAKAAAAAAAKGK